MATPRSTGKICIKKSSDGQWYFTVQSANGRILTTSETYRKHSSAVKGVDSLYRAMTNPRMDHGV